MFIFDFFGNTYSLAEVDQKFFRLIRLLDDFRLIVICINIYMCQMIAVIVADQIFGQAFLYFYILRTEKYVIPAGHLYLGFE